MIDWLVASLRHHVGVAFFLTLAIGYLVGKLPIGSFLSVRSLTRSLRAARWTAPDPPRFVGRRLHRLLA